MPIRLGSKAEPGEKNPYKQVHIDLKNTFVFHGKDENGYVCFDFHKIKIISDIEFDIAIYIHSKDCEINLLNIKKGRIVEIEPDGNFHNAPEDFRDLEFSNIKETPFHKSKYENCSYRVITTRIKFN